MVNEDTKLAVAVRRAGLAIVTALLCANPGFAQTPVSLFQGFVGHYNYEITGGSLRLQPNTVDPCAVGATSSNPIGGIPAGATPIAAYLYWAGSGSTVDSTVVLNGNTINANRTFTATFTAFGLNFDFFSGFADVTTLISGNGNGNYTFSGLTVNTGAPHCASSAVLAGWSLALIYEEAAEDLRAVNVFDGFQFFRGSSVTLTPNNFRVPPAPINGKYAVVTWEGDPQNSGPLNGFSENLTFNGALLDDGIIPPGSNPLVQQYDGTINGLGINNSHGVDVDTYDVSPYLSPGDTSATTVYSSGGDLVLLSAEVVSTTTEPVADLAITKSHTGDFTAGIDGVYTITVSNNGPEADANTIQVDDTLPAGLSYISGVGTGWTCTNTGQDVTCTHPGPLAVGASLPDITLTVAVSSTAVPSVDNTAVVSSASLDTTPGNDSFTDPTVVISPNLSTSTKTVLDLNSGDANPGDTLRYTITLNETGGGDATNVSVTDDIPANVQNFAVVSYPAGATDNSTGPGTGANGTGFLDISDITVPANSSVTIVFDVDVALAAAPGDIVANTATVTNPNGPGASPSAPNIIVAASQIPGAGTKPLYLYDLLTGDPNGFNAGPQPYLSRSPPTAPQQNVVVDKNQPPVTWTMTPATQGSLTIGAGSIPVRLWLSKGSGGGGSVLRTLTVRLDSIGATTGPIGTPVTQTFAAPASVSPVLIVFNIPLAAAVNLATGSQIILTLQNTTSGSGNRRIRVFPIGTGSNSQVDLNALTVINVDSVITYDAAFPGGSPVSQFSPNGTVYVRAVISDPFGSFDINPVTQPTITITDPLGTPQVVSQIMTEVADSGAATKTFEFVYVVPAAGPAGFWTNDVTGFEGTENAVTDLGTGTFEVVFPSLIVAKMTQTLSDPYNGTTNPKAIPGAVMLWSVSVTNQGSGTVDTDTLVMTDAISADTALFVDTSSGDPIVFIDGSTASGLSYNFVTDVAFSNQIGGGPPFTYVPVPDAAGFDPNVTGIRVNPTGIMNGASGGNTPSFSIRFRARVN